jgi:transposase-like protein
MARRQQLLGKLEEPRGRKRPKQPSTDSRSPRYPPEVKAKAYAAFLDGSTWADCARAIGHVDPHHAGARIIQNWAEEDHWIRPHSAGDYKSRVEKERSADPQRISDEVDDLCVQMQRVSEKYIAQYIDEETGEILINSSFKTRDFADMAAALRMIHETRIKIRKANEPKDGDKDGKKRDFLSMIREAGQNRLRENRRRSGVLAPQTVDDTEGEDDVGQKPTQDDQKDQAGRGESSIIRNLTGLWNRLESADGESRAKTEFMEADSGSDRE